MPTVHPKTQKGQIRKKSQKKTSGNGVIKVSLADLVFPTHAQLMQKIAHRVGRQPALPADLPQGDWSSQALRVLSERYLQKDDQGRVVETPEEMCWRVAWEIASAEALWGKSRKQVVNQAREYYQLLVSREFLPNSPTLMNAGTGNNLQYSACFVLPVEDSMEGIFDALKWQALIHKSGGGTGFAFSRLRPSGARVKTSSGVASGPVSFMRIFDAATNEVKQGGKRRGANMGILRVDHPDIMEFIHCKDEGGVTNFNISVALTDEFMQAYVAGEAYNLVDPRSGEVVGQLDAREVFDAIAEGAWKTGDPGVIFLDRRNRGSSNPVPALGPIEATNPCGEQELYPFDACNLGSIFLTYFVKEEKGQKQVDWEKLKKTVRVATQFLDSVIEVNPFPLEEIRRTVLGIRRIGLGVGGWADMLVELGIAYDSQAALELGEKIMRTIQTEAVAASQRLAKERGPFPLWPISVYKNELPRRNSTVTTIAPTGSISIIANSSSGIEPLFAIAYQHIVKDRHLSRTLDFINPKFEELARERGFWSQELKETVVERGTLREIEEVPQDVREIFGTAHEIHHDWHIRMQAAFQKYTENAVSKTINLRHEVTVDEIKAAYLLAWETECKGVTVFRDGSKDAQVLNLGVKDQTVEKIATLADGEVTIERPFMVKGATYRLETPVGSAFVTINEDENGNPLELFINVGKAGSDVAAMAEALGRTISTSLRFRGGLLAKERAEEIAHQLSGIGGRRSVGFGAKKVLSLPDAISVALSNHYGFKVNGNHHLVPTHNEAGADAVANMANGHSQFPKLLETSDPSLAPAYSPKTEVEAKDKVTTVYLQETLTVKGDICPSCGAGAFVYEEGCSKCYACGHSEC